MNPYREVPALTLSDDPPPWWMRLVVYVVAWWTGPALTGTITVTHKGRVREFHLDFDRRGRPSVVGVLDAALALEARGDEFDGRWRGASPEHEMEVLRRIATHEPQAERWDLLLAWARQTRQEERLRTVEAEVARARMPSP